MGPRQQRVVVEGRDRQVAGGSLLGDVGVLDVGGGGPAKEKKENAEGPGRKPG